MKCNLTLSSLSINLDKTVSNLVLSLQKRLFRLDTFCMPILVINITQHLVLFFSSKKNVLVLLWDSWTGVCVYVSGLCLLVLLHTRTCDSLCVRVTMCVCVCTGERVCLSDQSSSAWVNDRLNYHCWHLQCKAKNIKSAFGLLSELWQYIIELK